MIHLYEHNFKILTSKLSAQQIKALIALRKDALLEAMNDVKSLTNDIELLESVLAKRGE